VYPNPQVASYIQQNFLPVKIHIKEQPQSFQRFGARWTPTLILLDSEGTERYRFEGFLPAEDFLAHLRLGVGHALFARNQFKEAEEQFREVSRRYPNSEAAAEALYWSGVANYKATGNAGALQETAREFSNKYQQSSWAKRASVWAA
jgi:hypothetical protein